MKIFKHNIIPYNILALAAMLIIFSACEDVVDLKLPEGDATLVVEGQITNQPDVNQVKLTMSVPYFDSVSNPIVSNATVVLSDEQGQSVTLSENPANSGIYPILTPGTIGRTYTVEITTAEGKRFRSEPEYLAPVADIDSIYYELNESTDSTEEDEYDVLLDARETPNERNFYRWRLSVNGEFRNEPFDLFYASDDFLDGNDVIGFAVNDDWVYEGDELIVEQISISESYYEYLDLIWQQTAIVGGLFDSPPAPITGNIIDLDDRSKPVYGFFNASAIDRIEGVVTP